MYLDLSPLPVKSYHNCVVKTVKCEEEKQCTLHCALPVATNYVEQESGSTQGTLFCMHMKNMLILKKKLAF